MFHLLKTFANSLDPDQGQQNVTSDLDLNCWTLIVFLKKVCFERNQQMTKKYENYPVAPFAYFRIKVMSFGNQTNIFNHYYIPITDKTLELSVFWPSDIESRINELRFSESISLSFKTRLTSVTCFCGEVT